MRNEYRMMLSDYRWKNYRERVFNYHKKQCKCCNSDKGLQVHHLFYEKNKKPWEYDVETVVPLCADCHSKIHDGELYVEYENMGVTILPKDLMERRTKAFQTYQEMRNGKLNIILPYSCKIDRLELEKTDYWFSKDVMLIFKKEIDEWEYYTEKDTFVIRDLLEALWCTEGSRMVYNKDYDEWDNVIGAGEHLDVTAWLLRIIGCYAYNYSNIRVAWNIFHMAEVAKYMEVHEYGE